MMKNWGRLPLSPQEPGTRTQNQVQGRSYPGSRGAVPAARRAPLCSWEKAKRPGGLALRGHSPASGWPGQPRSPTAHPAGELCPASAAQRPRLLSGSPWPGAVSAKPQTASKNLARRRREVGHNDTATRGRCSAEPPPPLPQPQTSPAPPGRTPSAPSPARAAVAPPLPG